MTVKALEEFDVTRKDAERAKNMFALGLLSWLYDRPQEGTLDFLRSKFATRPEIMKANIAAFHAGWNFGETTEAFSVKYEVKPATISKGTYRNITGNTALAYGLIAGAELSGLPLFLGSYPITPASDILHELAKQKRFGVRTFQAEDEIAGVGAALGASFGGALGVTTTSGPGILLKAETIGLGVSLELPLIVCDIQRAGPSTGMPTKTEQGDLLQALYGRNGESPLPVIAPCQPGGLLRRRDRGHPAGGQVPHPGHPAVGRLPGQRLRALAHPGRGHPAGPDAGVLLRQPGRLARRRRPRHRFQAVPAGPEDAGPPLGRPGHPGPGTPDRRDREGRRDRGHLL